MYIDKEIIKKMQSHMLGVLIPSIDTEFEQEWAELIEQEKTLYFLYAAGYRNINDNICNYETTDRVPGFFYEDFKDRYVWTCSKCGRDEVMTKGHKPSDDEIYYCPKCGAKIINEIEKEIDNE